jgi:cysteine-rich repeat protein
MKCQPAINLSFAFLLVLAAGPARAGKQGGVCHAGKKVTICHVPRGNPANAHTITVDEHALRAHVAHGDQLGECPTGCGADASLCDDGNACTSDTCDASGVCQHQTVSCTDGNPCTLDLCEASTGCLSVANDGAPCDDGNACTGSDSCLVGVCQGGPIPGCCAENEDCDDADACTVDTCNGGSCANPPRDCSVVDKCVAGFCNADTGECETTPVSCSDANVCTDDFCDSASGCFSMPTASPPEAAESSCDDGADNDCDGAVDTEDADCSPVCGNGVLEPGEECDDGNVVNFDGCSTICTIEVGGGGD